VYVGQQQLQVKQKWACAGPWLLSSLLYAATLGTSGTALAAGEIITFAGNCAAGPDTSTSSTLNRHAVVGPRSAKRVMACTPSTPASAGSCRPVEVYRFDIVCNGQRRKWATVARNLARPLPFNRDALARVSVSPNNEFQLPTLSADGLPFKLRPPVGYAPLEELGARLEPAPYSSPTRQNPLRTLVTTSPLPDITPAGFTPDDDEPAFASASNLAPASEPFAQSEPSNGVSLAASALFAALAATLAVVRLYPLQTRKLGRHVSAHLGRSALQLKRIQATHQPFFARQFARLRWRLSRFGSLGQSRDINTANAAASVGALLTDTEQRLTHLRTAGPLTDVLRQELAHLRQRLDTLTISTAESDDRAARAAPSFRNLLRDVERVRRIADSAAMSLGGTRNPTRVPQTKSEAYAALGLNPDVAEPTLKKVADGLRMSWHPDLARDDADRNEREDRIKAINIALDLIHEKRIVA
jgi:hypothetical protein